MRDLKWKSPLELLVDFIEDLDERVWDLDSKEVSQDSIG